MDLLSIPDCYIKKGRPHGHRYGKKPGEREYKTANQLKKKCKKKFFQRIHDRFIRDETFRNRIMKMVETKMFVDNGMFLQMRIIPTIWHHKNITITKVIGGFVRTRQVPILCQCSADLTLNKHWLLCRNWNKKKKELAEINNGHRVLLLHGGVGKVLGGLLVPMKVTMEMNQVLIEQGDLLYKYLEQVFKAWFSWVPSLCYRWIVYNWRRSTVTAGVCKYHTSNDVFSRCKSVHKMATEKSDDELIQSDNKMRNGTRNGKFSIVNWIWLCDKAWRGRQWQHSWLRGTARCEHQRPLPLTPTWA